MGKMIYVMTIVFLFITRIRFPANKSIADIVTSRYGRDALQTMRKFEKANFKRRKLELDLDFLNKCYEQQLTPTFVRFRLPNHNLRQSAAYRRCQMDLLRQEIHDKEGKLHQAKRLENNLKQLIQQRVSMIDFAHITSFMLVHNDKLLNKVQLAQERKLLKLGFKSLNEGHDPDKVIFNFSSHELTDAEKRLLSKGLSFSIPPKTLNYGDALLPFELLFRPMSKAENISAEHMAACKAALQNEAHNMLHDFDPKKEQNLLQDEVEALRTLRSDTSIVIQKSDKGNSVVLLNKATYIQRMEELLADTTKFELLDIEDGKDYNHLWNTELRVRGVLQDLHKSKAFNEDTYLKLCPSGSRPGVMYGLAKVHKQLVDGFPKLRPILSAINTPTYRIAKYLVGILEPLTTDEFTVKDTFTFAQEIRTQDSTKRMCSFDVDALFTNIPLDETITICCNELFKGKHHRAKISGLTKKQFRSLLELATKESFILFNGKYYKQTDGVAMGSPLGPTLANIFLCHHEKSWLQQCPTEFKPVYFKRYVDDIFCLFESENHVQEFLTYLNSRHQNMNFTFEIESDNNMPFLDVKVIRSDSSFITSLYRKPTFSGVYTNFGSFIPELYKRNLVSTLLFRIFTICSTWELMHKEVMNLKNILKRNSYPRSLTDKLVKKFFDKMNRVRTPVTTVPKQPFTIVLPYLGSISNKVKRNLRLLTKKHLPSSDITVIFKSPSRLSSVFNFKDKLPAHLLSGVIYKYTCSSCNATYVGKTKRHTHHRFNEHAGLSPLTGVFLKGQNSTTVRDHMLVCDTLVTRENFILLGADSNNFHLRIKESLFIMREEPNLNIQGKSIPLTLF